MTALKQTPTRFLAPDLEWILEALQFVFVLTCGEFTDDLDLALHLLRILLLEAERLLQDVSTLQRHG